MRGITKLAIAAGVISLATAPCWNDKPKKSGMNVLADEIAMCAGVTETQQIGRNTQARIDVTLAPNAAIEEVETCVRSKVEKDGLMPSNFRPACVSSLSTTRTSQGISVIFDKTTCAPSR